MSLSGYHEYNATKYTGGDTSSHASNLTKSGTIAFALSVITAMILANLVVCCCIARKKRSVAPEPSAPLPDEEEGNGDATRQADTDHIAL